MCIWILLCMPFMCVVYIHVCTQTNIYIKILKYVCVCAYAHMFTFVTSRYTLIHTYIKIHIYTYTGTCIFICAWWPTPCEHHMRVIWHTRTHKNTHTHTHKHIIICASSQLMPKVPSLSLPHTHTHTLSLSLSLSLTHSLSLSLPLPLSYLPSLPPSFPPILLPTLLFSHSLSLSLSPSLSYRRFHCQLDSCTNV